MSVATSIHTALEQHLRAFAEPRGIRVARQGFAFSAPSDESYDAGWNAINAPAVYLRTTFLPNRNERLLVHDATHRRPGIFQIDVIGAVGEGLTPALSLADEVAQHFPMDAVLLAGGISLRVTAAPSIAPPIIEAASLQVPVSVLFETFA